MDGSTSIALGFSGFIAWWAGLFTALTWGSGVSLLLFPIFVVALGIFLLLTIVSPLAFASDERLRRRVTEKAWREVEERNAAMTDADRERDRQWALAALARSRAILNQADAQMRGDDND